MTRKGRKPAVPGKKRTVYVGAKVTPAQKEHIDRLARECGMTTSSYVLARVYNYEPKARLNPKEQAIAVSFSGYSDDVDSLILRDMDTFSIGDYLMRLRRKYDVKVRRGEAMRQVRGTQARHGEEAWIKKTKHIYKQV